MKINSLRTIAVAAIATIGVAAPLTSSAQRYGGRDYRYEYRDSGLRDQVDHTERESNSFRDYFEHHFRWRGHAQRYIPETGYDRHAEHQGRNGQMTLGDAIQNLDEDFERLRAEVDHNGRTRRSSDLMDEIVDHMSDVNTRIVGVRDGYEFSRDRNWRYDGSALSSSWRDLRADINDLARSFGPRGR
jgi:hypothetical protein